MRYNGKMSTADAYRRAVDQMGPPPGKSAIRAREVFATLSETEWEAINIMAKEQMGDEIKYKSRAAILRAAIDFAFRYWAGFEQPEVFEDWDKRSKAEGLGYGYYRYSK